MFTTALGFTFRVHKLSLIEQKGNFRVHKLSRVNQI